MYGVDEIARRAACSHAVGRHDATLVTDRTRAWPMDTESDDAPLPRGARVGRYLVLGELGRGGMGIVYRAYDPELDRPLALKRMRMRGLPPDSPAHARLRREAQTLARLAHPHVVTIFDVGHDDAGLFLAMELVEGEDLASWMSAGPQPWPAVVERLAAAGEGLAAAHRVGVVHRDFKPANVLLGRDGRVAVTDFGLARPETTPTEASTGDEPPPEPPPEPMMIVEHEPALTDHGTRVGTPAYMAPEQHRGEAADQKADQFAFCASLYRALYGRHAFAGRDVDALFHSKTVGKVQTPADDDAGTHARGHREARSDVHPEPVRRRPVRGAALPNPARRCAHAQRGGQGPARRRTDRAANLRNNYLEYVSWLDSILPRSANSRESMGQCCSLGNENSSFPSYCRISLAGRPYCTCYCGRSN